jgi:hypothetical protein
VSAMRALIILGLSTLLVVGGIAYFNYTTDAQCYYQCPEVVKEKRTLNHYYQMAQRLMIYKDTQIVVVGSSRGESTPPLWIQTVEDKRALNLSAAGAELSTKRALLKVAQENNSIKKVYWFADYFDLITETQDVKIKKTPALRRYLNDPTQSKSWREHLAWLQGLIDHNTTSASLHFLKRPPSPVLGQGGLDDPNNLCEKEEFRGKETESSLKTKINVLYEAYTQKVLRPPQNETAWQEFEDEMRFLKSKNIEVVVLILPYHPDFLSRLKKEHPDLYKKHQIWAARIEQFKAMGVRVLNYLDGVEGDDGSAKFWDDGVHVTCHMAIKMLRGKM